jgi:hypothetical protein
MRFEWDRRKANSNLTKHDVSFEEAATVLEIRFRLQFLIGIIPMQKTGPSFWGAPIGQNYWLWSSPKEGKYTNHQRRPASRRERKIYEENI